jgi:hypothetical protein
MEDIGVSRAGMQRGLQAGSTSAPLNEMPQFQEGLFEGHLTQINGAGCASLQQILAHPLERTEELPPALIARQPILELNVLDSGRHDLEALEPTLNGRTQPGICRRTPVCIAAQPPEYRAQKVIADVGSLPCEYE